MGLEQNGMSYTRYTDVIYDIIEKTNITKAELFTLLGLNNGGEKMWSTDNTIAIIHAAYVRKDVQ